MPRLARNARNRWYTLSGLSRSATVVIGQPLRGDPGPGGVPVAGVRQRDHRAPAGRHVGGQQVVAAQPEAGAAAARGSATGSRNASSQ